MNARVFGPVVALAVALAIGCMPAVSPVVDGSSRNASARTEAADRLEIQADAPRTLDLGQSIKPAAGGVMVVSVKWPPIGIQAIPAGTRCIMIYVYKFGSQELKAEPQKITRPTGLPFPAGTLVTASAFPVNYAGKVTVEAIAFPTFDADPTRDTPTGSGIAYATIADGQETPVRIVIQSGSNPQASASPSGQGGGGTGASPTPTPTGSPDLLCQVNPALCGGTPAPTPTPTGGGASATPSSSPTPTPQASQTPSPTPTPTPADFVTGIQVTADNTTLRPAPDSPNIANLTAKVQFSVSNEVINPTGMTWISSDPSRILVTSSGQAAVQSNATSGTVRIDAVYRGATGSIQLTVQGKRGSLDLTIN